MDEEYRGIPEEAYLRWLELLAKEAPGQTAALIPGVVLETSRECAASVWAERLIAPLEKMGLFPFQGEVPWVETICTSWEQTETIPRRLARLCSGAAGLWGCFRGGLVLDLRRCCGKPPEGQLNPLERFLLESTGELSPLILVPPGAGSSVRSQLQLVDLQQIVPQKTSVQALEEDLRQAAFLSPEDKALMLQQAEQTSPECAAVALRTLQRLADTGCGAGDTRQLLTQIMSGGIPHRKIGFERGMER